MAETVRPTGTEELMRRFPDARGLWQLTATNQRGFVTEFRVSAWAINGRVVLLQEFDETRGHSWEVFVPATEDGRTVQTLDAVARAVGLSE